MNTQSNQPLSEVQKFGHKILLVTATLLLIVPVVWAISHPSIQAKFTVLQSAAATQLSNTSNQTYLTERPEYAAELIFQSHDKIRVKEGERVRVRIMFKNIGTKPWTKTGTREFIAINVKDPISRTSAFRDASWDEPNERYHYRPGRLSDDYIVQPGGIGTFYVTLKAPNKPGSYVENFGLVSEWHSWLPGGDITIPITVDPVTAPEPDNQRRGETIRVGLAEINSADFKGKFKVSGTGIYRIKDPEGNQVAIYRNGEIVTVSFKNGKYQLESRTFDNARGWQHEMTGYPTFEPESGEYIELVNLDDRPAWNPGLNDNYFRGSIEIRHSDKTNQTWAINKLPLEAYVRGVAESSNSTPKEMLRTMAVVERSYAEYHRRSYQKFRDNYFHVANTTASQVYKGVGYELRSPNMTQAVHDTTGQFVTYDNNLVITPYFSRSDGYTRNVEDVWGGSPKPWLKAVHVPWSKDKKMLGHGVGLDAQAGAEMASEGYSYKQILGYFYKGIKIKTSY